MENFLFDDLKKSIEYIQNNLEVITSKHEQLIEYIEKTFERLDFLVPYYIVPNAQNLNPADFIDDDTGLVAKNNVFDLLNNFFSSGPRFTHTFILSDAGMGKSSLLVMVRLISLVNSDKIKVHLLKLGKHTTEKIALIENPTKTILLLDALDEDSEAWENFYTRLQLLLQETKYFHKVIITCRTQFFPHQYEEDGRVPGQINLHGFHCSKLFLSPFDDSQVNKYIERKFSDQTDRKKAQLIIDRMNSLKFRPMLLSYIDLLLDRNNTFETTYDIYETLVDEWLNRELRKGVITSKRPLMKACKQIAFKMYSNNKARILKAHEIMDLCSDIKGLNRLPYLSVEGRSLLHINSEGDYKFAHFSIQEFFVASSLLNSSTERKFIENTDQVIGFIGDFLAYRDLENKDSSFLDIRGIILKNKTLNAYNFKNSDLSKSKFENDHLNNMNFQESNLQESNFDTCIIVSCDYNKAKLNDSIFRQCEFKKFKISDLNINNIQFKDCKVLNSSWNNLKLESSKIVSEFFDSKFISLDIFNSIDTSLSFFDCEMKNINIDGCIIESLVLGRCGLSDWEILNSEISKIHHVEVNVTNLKIQDLDSSDFTAEKSFFKNVIFNNTKIKQFNCSFSEFESSELMKIKIEKYNSTDSKWNNLQISNIDFLRSHFVNHIFTQNKFHNSFLANIVLQSSIINSCHFTNNDLSNLTIYSGEIHNSIFTNNKFDSTTIDHTQILESDFKSSNMKNSKITYSNIINSNFQFVDLSNSIVNDCLIKESDFSKANLSKTDLTNVEFNNVKLDGAKYDSETKWPENFDFKNQKALGPYTVISLKTLFHKNLNNYKLESSRLSDSQLKGAILSNIDFSNAILTNSKIEESEIEGCIFDSADLSKSYFYNVKVRNVNFSNANFEDARFLFCVFYNCNLKSAKLQKANFNGSSYNSNTSFPDEFLPRNHKMKPY